MAEVLVLVDSVDGNVKKSTLELLTAARAVGEPAAVVVGAPGTACAAAAAAGAPPATPPAGARRAARCPVGEPTLSPPDPHPPPAPPAPPQAAAPPRAAQPPSPARFPPPSNRKSHVRTPFIF